MKLNNDSKFHTAVMKRNQKRIGFIGATCSLAAVYAASSAPIPLYSTYRQIIGLTSGILSMTAVAYFIGTVVALLVFSRLSNYFGRRPMVLTTLGLAVIGCLVFFYIHNAPMFFAGRFIQGFSCGLASSTVAAFVVDNAPAGIAAAVTSAAPMIELAAGSFGSGALNQYDSGSLTLIFGVLMVVLAICVAMIAFSHETVARTKGAAASLIPQIRVPQNIRRLLPAAGCTFVGTWAVGGFYQAFSSSMATEQLGTNNKLVAAAVFACLMAPNAFGAFIVGRMKPDKAQRSGMLAFFLCVVAILVSLKLGATVPFLISSVLAGIAQGTAFTGSMRRLLDKTSQEDRAGVLSTIYLISYIGAAVPNLIVGRLSSYFSLFEIAVGYGLLVMVACVMTLLTTAGTKADLS